MPQKTIYEVLEGEHRQVRELMERAHAATDADERMRLIGQISQELMAHAEAESATFYAQLREAGESELVDAAEREHEEVAQLLERLDHSPEGAVESNLARLQELVETHVEEEETEIFDRARAAIPDEDAQDLARRFQEEKQELMSQDLLDEEMDEMEEELEIEDEEEDVED